MADEERLTANVTKTTGGGSFYHADCPYCGKFADYSNREKDLSPAYEQIYIPTILLQ